MQYKAFFSYLEEEIVIEKSNKSSIVLKEKTSHLRKKQNTTKKEIKKINAMLDNLKCLDVGERFPEEEN